MSVTLRKVREFKQREETFLETARELLLDDGYHGLTMARIGQRTGYSKGTVYLHFHCKEEVITALAGRSFEKQQALVERAAMFQGRPRERMMAVAEATELFARLHADDARIFQIMNGEAITQKASPEALGRLKTAAHRTMEIMMGIVRDAIAQRDLVLTGGTTAEELAYALWVLGDSGKAASSSWFRPEAIGVVDPFKCIIKTGLILGDGYGWRPLSTEWDYEATLKRVRAEVFTKECRQVYGG